ncbi:MAG: leucine-rich repeat domain-containing protein [Eubacteriales bacterium]
MVEVVDRKRSTMKAKIIIGAVVGVIAGVLNAQNQSSLLSKMEVSNNQKENMTQEEIFTDEEIEQYANLGYEVTKEGKLTGYTGSDSDIEIPKGIVSIGSNAFHFSVFQSVADEVHIILPEGVMSIDSGAFYGCYNLTSVEIPESVISIGDYAFYNCDTLTNIEIPKGVTSIGSETFRDCSSLASIEIPEGVTRIGSGAFHGCRNLISIEISK